MYVRLAFSVAAHLEPEILLVDEVLAVGDAEFQQRCLGRMEDFSGTGRTVLFVSHNMQAINQLCDRVIWLDGGEIVEDGDPSEVVSALPAHSGRAAGSTHVLAGRRVGARRRARAASLGASAWTTDGETVDTIDVRRAVGIEIGSACCVAGRPTFAEDQGAGPAGGPRVQRAWTSNAQWHGVRRPGVYTATAWIPPNLLNEGLERASTSRFARSTRPSSTTTCSRSTRPCRSTWSTPATETRLAGGSPAVRGVVRPLLEWTTERVEGECV